MPVLSGILKAVETLQNTILRADKLILHGAKAASAFEQIAMLIKPG